MVKNRRDFLRWGATVAACLGLERARFLNVINDTAGSAAADTAALCDDAPPHSLPRRWRWSVQLDAHLAVPEGHLLDQRELLALRPGQGCGRDGLRQAVHVRAGLAVAGRSVEDLGVRRRQQRDAHQHAHVGTSSLGGNTLLASAAAIQQANPHAPARAHGRWYPVRYRTRRSCGCRGERIEASSSTSSTVPRHARSSRRRKTASCRRPTTRRSSV